MNVFLNNTGDSVQLLSASDALIDEVNYDDCSSNVTLAVFGSEWRETTEVTKRSENVYLPVAQPSPHGALTSPAVPRALTTQPLSVARNQEWNEENEGAEVLGAVEENTDRHGATVSSEIATAPFGMYESASGERKL